MRTGKRWRIAMRHVEDDMACRVRVDGQDVDRVTGNVIALRVTHRTTRPNEDDKTPDPVAARPCGGVQRHLR